MHPPIAKATANALRFINSLKKTLKTKNNTKNTPKTTQKHPTNSFTCLYIQTNNNKNIHFVLNRRKPMLIFSEEVAPAPPTPKLLLKKSSTYSETYQQRTGIIPKTVIISNYFKGIKTDGNE